MRPPRWRRSTELRDDVPGVENAARSNAGQLSRLYFSGSSDVLCMHALLLCRCDHNVAAVGG